MADKRISQLTDRGTVANNDVVPIVVSGAVTTNKATISSIQTFMQGNLDLGVTSVGFTLTQTDGQQISVTGSPITTSGNITLNLPRATNSIRGLLDSEDFINFSNKQSTITLTTTGTSGAATLVSNTLNIPNYAQDLSGFVTLGTAQTITAQKTITTNGGSDTFIVNHTSGSGIGVNITKGGNGEGLIVNKTSGSGNAATITGTLQATTIVRTGGTSSQFLKADGSVDSTVYYPNSNPSGFTSNVGTVTSVAASAPLASSGGATPNVTITQASGSTNGFLSSTDFNTFNNKQNALTNPVTGTGTTNLLPKFTGASTVGNSQIFDNGTNVGINTETPVAKFTVNQLPVAESGSTSYGTAVIHGINYNLSNTQRGIVDINYIDVGAQNNGSTLTFTNNAGMFGQGNSFVGVGLKAGKSTETNQDQSTYFAISTNNNGSLTEKLRITHTGNVGIGTDTPAHKLDVDGAIRTGNPTNSTARPFKIGDVETSNANIYDGTVLKVDINGTVYNLMIADLFIG